MATRPIKDKVFIEFEPMSVHAKWHGLHLPDEHYIKYCTRCGKAMEALDSKCGGTEIFEMDEYRDRPVFKEVDYSHDVTSVKAPAYAPACRKGVVLAVGTEVRDVAVGDCVLVATYAKGVEGDFGMVKEEVILGVVNGSDSDVHSERRGTEVPVAEV